MPTYEYVCKKCEQHLEVVQTFNDAPLTVCPNCKGKLRKVFGNIGIAFKGSGFYKTDSRGKQSSAAIPKADGVKADGAKSDGAKSDGAKSDGPKSDGPKSEPKTEKKSESPSKTASAS